jgi:hypothetical protein
MPEFHKFIQGVFFSIELITKIMSVRETYATSDPYGAGMTGTPSALDAWT